MKFGEYSWLKLFERSVGWASVLPTEDWKKPFRCMGPIELSKVRPPPPPPHCFPCIVEYETPKARLVEIEGRKYWLPKSRSRLSDDERRIEIEDWLWRQKRLEPVD